GSRHSDQYSLAATYAELRLNRRIFDGNDMMQMMLQHVERTPNLEPLPQAEQHVLLKALAKKAAERYGSCLEFWEALHQALVSEGVLLGDRSEGSHRGAGGTTKEPGEQPTPVMAASLSQAEVAPPTIGPDAMPASASSGTGAAVSTAQPPVARLRRRPLLRTTVYLVCSLLIPLIAWRGCQLIFPEVDFLPKGYERADGAEIVPVKDQKVYSRIAYVLPDQTRIVFLLIPQARATDPPPFYIMEDKVSNKLFRVF